MTGRGSSAPARRPAAHTPASRLVDLAGVERFAKRIEGIGVAAGVGSGQGRLLRERFAPELALWRLRSPEARPTCSAERALLDLASTLVRIHASLPAEGRARLLARLREGLAPEGSIAPLLHLAHLGLQHRARGFQVTYPQFERGEGPDLHIERDGVEAELLTDTVSAEEGRWVHRGDWFALVDRINPDLQSWLASHPGRYLLKMTLPTGLGPDSDLGELHTRIMKLLEESRKSEQSEAVVLKLDPLLLAASQAGQGESRLVDRLRAQFGPEAHLAVAAAQGGVFVMAARAGRENEVASAIRKHLQGMRHRLSGKRPGILALFVEDTDRIEWRSLRDKLEIEGAARNFLTEPGARDVVAVTCVSRFELFRQPVPDAAPDGELRFRNPSHPQAKNAALAPAILSLA